MSKEDLEKIKELDEFDEENLILQTSGAQYIQFKVQLERSKRKDSCDHEGHQEIGRDNIPDKFFARDAVL